MTRESQPGRERGGRKGFQKVVLKSGDGCITMVE